MPPCRFRDGDADFQRKNSQIIAVALDPSIRGNGFCQLLYKEGGPYTTAPVCHYPEASDKNCPLAAEFGKK